MGVPRCRECLYVGQNGLTGDYLCYAPENSGKVHPWTYCETERKSGICGPKGTLWVQKPPLVGETQAKGLLRRIFG